MADFGAKQATGGAETGDSDLMMVSSMQKNLGWVKTTEGEVGNTIPSENWTDSIESDQTDTNSTGLNDANSSDGNQSTDYYDHDNHPMEH